MGYKKNLLPLFVEVIVDPAISDCHHDNQNSEKNNADQKLIDGPHGHCCRFQIAAKKNIKKCNALTWFSWPVANFFATSNPLLSWPMPVYSRSWQLWMRPNMLKHYGRFCQISSGFLDGCAITSSIYKFCFSLAKPRGFNLFIFSEILITVTFIGNKCYRIGSFKYETVCSLQVVYFIQISRIEN